MTLPSVISLLRALAVGPVIVLLGSPETRAAAVVLFAAAALTDAVDGPLARRRREATAFGAFLDPLADKVLVLGTLAGLLAHGAADPVALWLILAREAIVTAARAIAAGRGLVVGSSAYGKAKACLQGMAVAARLVVITWPELLAPAVADGVLWAAVAATLATGIEVVRRAVIGIAAVGPSTMRAHAR